MSSPTPSLARPSGRDTIGLGRGGKGRSEEAGMKTGRQSGKGGMAEVMVMVTREGEGMMGVSVEGKGGVG